MSEQTKCGLCPYGIIIQSEKDHVMSFVPALITLKDKELISEAESRVVANKSQKLYQRGGGGERAG